MDRRQFLKIAGLGAAAMSRPRLLLGSSEAGRHPNVLLILSDQHRASAMGCSGDPNVDTPNLDAFARQGIRMDAAYSGSPVCCPARAALMTGKFGHHNGMISNYMDFYPAGPMLGETFKSAGYFTGYIGRWHLNFPEAASINPAKYGDIHSEYTLVERRFGFDWWRGAAEEKDYFHYTYFKGDEKFPTAALPEYQPYVMASHVEEFLNESKSRQSPWLLAVSWLPPHTPYEAPENYLEKYRHKRLQLMPNVPAGLPAEYARKHLARYYPMVEAVDEAFGRIMRLLEAQGLAENTIVVYTADHGDMLGSHGYVRKRWPHDESARVPFLMRWPEKLTAGRVLNTPNCTPDIFPTLAGLAGIPVPAGLDGRDYSGFLTGKTNNPPKDHAYLQMMYGYVPWPGWRAIRTPEYLYARTAGQPWLFFDMQKDPGQNNNLVKHNAQRLRVREIDRHLIFMMEHYGDSWDIKGHSGDVENWLPGGKKQRSSDLGIGWPGKQI